MTMTAERQMELTLPMVPDIEIAAARAAGNLAREVGMSAERIDEMASVIAWAAGRSAVDQASPVPRPRRKAAADDRLRPPPKRRGRSRTCAAR